MTTISRGFMAKCVQLRPDEADLINAAAGKVGSNPHRFMRDVCLGKAAEILGQNYQQES